jgi:putative ABC transport system permease protein
MAVTDLEESGHMAEHHIKANNPLSWWIYLRRNGKVLPIAAVLLVSVLGITTLVTLFDNLAMSMEVSYGQLGRVSIVSSADPGKIARVRTNPHVKAVYPSPWFGIQIPLVLSRDVLPLFAVPQENINDILTLYNAHMIAGRLPNRSAAEFVVSKEVAKARGLKVGDIVGPSTDDQDAWPVDFTLVGILESDERIGFVSYEYLTRDSHFSQSLGGRFLVTPKDGEKDVMDRFLLEEVVSRDTPVTTYETEERKVRQTQNMVYLILGAIDLIIIVVLSITTGMLNYIFLTQRMGEFALLRAIGYSKWKINQRLLGELGVLVCVAWVVGELLAIGVLLWVGANLFIARGQDFQVLSLRAVAYTMPIPIIVVVVGIAAVTRLLSRLDPVSIIERRF